MAQLALGECVVFRSALGLPECDIGLGAETCVYENARLLADGDLRGFDTGLAGVEEKSVVVALTGVGFVDDGGLGDSESDALSHASSSAQSIAA